MYDARDLFPDKPYSQNIKMKSKGHFTMVHNAFIMDENFTTYEKIVWLVIKKYKMRHETAWPSIDTIAKKAGCGDSSVKKAVKGLVSKGMIKVERKSNHRSNVYTVIDIPP